MGASYLGGADLSRADLTGAKLFRAHCGGAVFRDANMRGANLGGAQLSGANLIGASLIEARLGGVNLYGANLAGADLTQSVMGRTILGNVDLRRVRGLVTIYHQAPSTIGVDTCYRSGGQIPKDFLIAAGVPESFLDYLDTLAGQPSSAACLISCAVEDERAAADLSARLRRAGVQCWLRASPVDMKPTASILRTELRMQDHLLLMVSETSAASRWLPVQVTEALAEETERGPSPATEGGRAVPVLIPIRMNGCALGSDQEWSRALMDRPGIEWGGGVSADEVSVERLVSWLSGAARPE